VLLWAVLAAVPVAFAAMLALAWWATETPGAEPTPAAAPRPANETAPLSRAA
jgi:hypothetical protein